MAQVLHAISVLRFNSKAYKHEYPILPSVLCLSRSGHVFDSQFAWLKVYGFLMKTHLAYLEKNLNVMHSLLSGLTRIRSLFVCQTECQLGNPNLVSFGDKARRSRNMNSIHNVRVFPVASTCQYQGVWNMGGSFREKVLRQNQALVLGWWHHRWSSMPCPHLSVFLWDCPCFTDA